MDRNAKRKDPPSNSDDEDALLVVSETQQLSWRLDPEESHSDWTIIIDVDGKTHSTYNVHKIILSFGSKKSKYFESLFRNTGMKEHEGSTSKIELRRVAAKAFPDLLDFMYSCNDDIIPITAETSAGLYHLGEFLDIPSIRSAVRSFWKNQLDISGFAICYEHCKILDCRKAHKEIVARILKTLPDHISDEIFLASTNDDFWWDLLQTNKSKPHPNLSVWIAQYCLQQKHQMDFPVFLQLTDDSSLPKLHLDAATTLFEVEKHIVPGSIDGGQLSPLQKRCIEVVVTDWEAFDRPGRDVSRLSPFLLSKALTRSLELAKAAKSDHERVIHSMFDHIIYVSVSGATDIPAVNGVYEHGSGFRYGTDGNEFNSYSKPGMYQGQEVDFEIWLSWEEGSYKWTLETKEHEEALYQVELQSLTPPPVQGWMKKGQNGWMDAPEVQFKCDSWLVSGGSPSEVMEETVSLQASSTGAT